MQSIITVSVKILGIVVLVCLTLCTCVCVCVCVCVYAGVHQGMVLVDAEADDFKRLALPIRGLHGSKNSYPNPKRPVNRVQTTGELGGVRLPLIIHGLP